MFKVKTVRLALVEKFGIMATTFIASLFCLVLGLGSWDLHDKFIDKIGESAFIIIGIFFPIAVFLSINGRGVHRNMHRKFIKKKLKEGVRILYRSDIKAKTEFDKSVDECILYLFIAICNYYNINPSNNINNTEYLLYKIAAMIESNIHNTEADRGLFKWLNTHAFPHIENLIKYNINTTDIHYIESMMYSIGVLRKELVDNEDQLFTRFTIIIAADRFINTARAILSDNIDKSTQQENVIPPISSHVH